MVETSSEPPRLFPNSGSNWPPVLYVPKAVAIHYTVGYGTDPKQVPSAVRVAMRQLVALWDSNPSLIDSLVESATNPRCKFDEAKLEDLAESIRTQGLIMPLVVRPKGDLYEIVAGARRYRAAKRAQMETVPARIVELTDEQMLAWQLIENSQRVDVHPEHWIDWFHITMRITVLQPG